MSIQASKETREELAEGPSRLLADTYTLYPKTHEDHWNVTGPMFRSLLDVRSYMELCDAVDLIA